MTIEVPDSYAARFALFERIEAILKDAYSTEGVSRLKIGQLFGSVCLTGTCWRDPAFIIWAGLKGCAQYGDFYKLWDGPEEVAAETEDESVGVGG